MTARHPDPREHAAPEPVHIWAPAGIPELRPGDDLAGILAANLTADPHGLRDGDILVLTSKAVSKVEGRLVAAPHDPEARDALRRELVEREAVRVVARIHRTLITENRLGIVQAASGVDGSNVAAGEIALLPEDPDTSARELAVRLQQLTGLRLGILITDTMGRAWRRGQTDAAIGAAGMRVLASYAGAHDASGHELLVTEIAVGDELAAAADLAKGKTGGRPVAVVRGCAHLLDPAPGEAQRGRDLVRESATDLFRLGTAEALAQGRREAVPARRSVRRFKAEPVAPELLREALADALTAPAPHHSHPVRFIVLRDPQRRSALLDAMRDAWDADLRGDGFTDEQRARRISRGEILRTSPALVLPFLDTARGAGPHHYPDSRRSNCEATMFTAAGGAAVQSLLIALAARGIGSCWVGSTIFAAETVHSELELPSTWQPLGAVAIGYPTTDPVPREPLDPEPYLRII